MGYDKENWQTLEDALINLILWHEDCRNDVVQLRINNAWKHFVTLDEANDILRVHGKLEDTEANKGITADYEFEVAEAQMTQVRIIFDSICMIHYLAVLAQQHLCHLFPRTHNYIE